MKTKRLTQLMLFILFICLPALTAAKDKNKPQQDAESTSVDSTTYDLIVFEIGYESFLLQQHTMEFYSECYYKNWNTLYVAEWNFRYITNNLVGADQEQIFYDNFIEYGIELEYKLYHFFRFYEHKYGVKLLNRVGG